ncbi:hypothetical protein VTJ04DRAFT_518 [Mycothermus thermophilus]|uniref:uncharacterized protein n=1 Tax=Humicola insolens TaxID=85995 RepID=UPI0037424FA0
MPDSSTSIVEWTMEHLLSPNLGPFMRSWVGHHNAKENSLMKKTISFDIAGQKVTVVNYYRVADVVEGRLPRPRLLSPGLRRQGKVRIVDDGGRSPAASAFGWSPATEVPEPDDEAADEELDHELMDIREVGR